MKSNRGITLTSLVIYIIGLMMIITLMGTFTNYFLSNINEVVLKDTSEEQYANFLSYITKDINSEDLEFVNDTEGYYVILYFKNNIQHQYIFENNTIYYLKLENDILIKNIAICNDVSSSVGNVFKFDSNKLSYSFSIGSDEFSGNLNV